MSDPQRLDDLRAEIDRLDTVLHDTLMARAQVVAEVARVKGRASGSLGTALRPDREAAMARRLVERHSGPFPMRSLQRIWREIVNATTQEVQMRFAVHLGAADVETREAARFAFGNASELVPHATPLEALEAAGRAETDLAALPIAGGAWWAQAPERAGVIMRAGDLLVLGPLMEMDWDVRLAITEGPQPGLETLSRAGDGRCLVAGDVTGLDPSVVIRHIGGYMDGPWVAGT